MSPNSKNEQMDGQALRASSVGEVFVRDESNGRARTENV